MTVIDLPGAKHPRRARRDLVPLDKTSGPSRFFHRCVREIEGDLGGRQNLSRIEGELVRAFAGAATTLQYLNVQVALGDISELDLGSYATLASTLVRLGSRLGLQRRAKDIVPSLAEYLEGTGNAAADDEVLA